MQGQIPCKLQKFPADSGISGNSDAETDSILTASATTQSCATGDFLKVSRKAPNSAGDLCDGRFSEISFAPLPPTEKTNKRDGNHSLPVGERAQSNTACVHPSGDRNDRNGCSGWLARRGAPHRGICAARGNRSTARRLHGGRPDVVQLGDSEQGTHSDLLGVEDGSAYAAVPGSVCQALTDRLTDVRLTPKGANSRHLGRCVYRKPHPY